MCKKFICVVSFVLLLCVSIDNVNADIKSDLISHWKFDEGSGTIARDSAGSNDGTLRGDATWAQGWLIGAVELDGDDDYVDCGQGTAFNSVCRDVITLAAWVKVNIADGSQWSGIIIRGYGEQFGNVDPYDTFAMYYHGPTERMGFKTNSTSPEWMAAPNNSATVLFDGEWHHTASVYDGAEKVIYLDAEEIITEPATGRIGIGEGDGRILIGGGRDVDPMVLELGGLVDDARIYDRALTQEEIVAVMENIENYPNALSPNPPIGAMIQDTWANLSWRAGDFAVSHNIYVGDNFDDINAGAEGTFIGNQADTFIIVGFPGFPYPDGLVPGTTYYWRIDEVNDTEPNSPWKGDVWSFMVPPKTAYFPDPADGTESVDVDVTLSWTPGFGAKLHTVYFGDNLDEVSNASGGLPKGTVTHTPGMLEMAKTYYWRVDEFDVIETHKGDVWSFTTEGAVGTPNPANGA
ncbi:MAG: LamG domain-containing protein, partial [Planctomycetota bacterium]